MTEPTTPTCGRPVYWWDGEYEGNCELPEGHDGDHWDGFSWFDDNNEDTTASHPEPGPRSDGVVPSCGTHVVGTAVGGPIDGQMIQCGYEFDGLTLVLPPEYHHWSTTDVVTSTWIYILDSTGRVTVASPNERRIDYDYRCVREIRQSASGAEVIDLTTKEEA